MPTKDDLNRLYHMFEAARDAISFSKGRKREDIKSERQLSYSLIRCLEIIGEAAGKVSPETKNEYSQIRWDPIIGMRHRLIHAYFEVNLNIVWKTENEEIPELIKELEPILRSEEML